MSREEIPVLVLALVIAVSILAGIPWYRSNRRWRERFAARWTNLCARFGESDALRIINGEIWVGQTAEMLREALGEPVAKEEKVLLTKSQVVKSQVIWKYRPIGEGRYKTRITLENDVVVVWDVKRWYHLRRTRHANLRPTTN